MILLREGTRKERARSLLYPLKAQQILDWPEPTTDKAVHRLLGFTNFIRDYIPLYAQITAPLERLKNIKKFKMEGAQLRASTPYGV